MCKCHIIKFFVHEETAEERIAVPYDFDASGLVDAEYAAPPSHIPIRSVRARYYRGMCQPRDVLDAAVDQIRSKKDEIMALVVDMDEFSSYSKGTSTKYLADFFELLDDEKEFKAKVVDRCRGMEEILELSTKELAITSN